MCGTLIYLHLTYLYKEGNYLRRSVIDFSLNREKEEFNYIKSLFTKNFFNENKNLKFNNSTPIFILGMPRSGTTLVEQIISSHSKVHGAGELSLLERFGGKLSCGAQDIRSDNLIDVRNSYLDELGKVSDNKQFVTDKMPHNFLHIGLILKALPEAKIIHVKRNPARFAGLILSIIFLQTI